MDFFWPLAILAVLGVAFLTWRRRKQEQTADDIMPYQEKPSAFKAFQSKMKPNAWMSKRSHKTEPSTQSSPMVSLNLVAATGDEYRSYDLLQALSNVGLKYGLMKIFHRHETPHGEGATLFSVASINKPGTFEMENMGGYACPGLTMFSDLTQTPDPLYTFDLMIETAHQLIEQLGGALYADQTTPMTVEMIEQMRDTLYNAYAEKETA